MLGFILGMVSTLGIISAACWFFCEGTPEVYRIVKEGDDYRVIDRDGDYGCAWHSSTGDKWCWYQNLSNTSGATSSWESQDKAYAALVEQYGEPRVNKSVYIKAKGKKSPACRFKKALYNWLKEDC